MKLTLDQIQTHLTQCSPLFVPELGSYVDISLYSSKIHNNAVLFSEIDNGVLIGLVAAYDNPSKKFGWVTNVSVHPNHLKKGIATKLLNQCYCFFKEKNYSNIFLEVFNQNQKAINLYKKQGFTIFSCKF